MSLCSFIIVSNDLTASIEPELNFFISLTTILEYSFRLTCANNLKAFAECTLTFSEELSKPRVIISRSCVGLVLEKDSNSALNNILS